MGIFIRDNANKGRYEFSRLSASVVFSVLVVFTALLLLPLGRFMSRRMEEVRNDWIRKAERRLGRSITYASMGPSILGGIDIRNVQVEGKGGVPVLAVSRLWLSFSLLDMFREGAPSIRSVRIDKPQIDFDAVRDGDLLDRLRALNVAPSGAGASSGGLAGVLSMLPEAFLIRVRGGDVRVAAGGNVYRASALDFDIASREGRFFLDGKISASVFLGGLSLNADMPAVFSLSLARDLGEGEASLVLSSLRGDFFSSGAFGADLSLRDGVVSVRKKPDSFPYDVSLDYDRNRGLALALRCDDVVPGAFFSFSGNMERYNSVLDTPVRGTALFSARGKGVEYSVDLAGGGAFKRRFFCRQGRGYGRARRR